MQMPCWILVDQDASKLALAVGQEDVARASTEIEEYEFELQAERLNARAGRSLPSYGTAPWLALVYALTLYLCFFVQTSDPAFEQRLISDNFKLIDDGENYRAAGALLLHGDLFHLLGNIAFGIVFGLLVATSIGGFTGWILIAVSGIVGNYINAHHFYPGQHRSLGASTAVFGALGILTGYGLIAAFLSPKTAPWARVIIPIAGGFALLSYLGIGDEQTDIMAHFYGFAVGAPLGFLAGWVRILRDGELPAGEQIEVA